MTAAGHAAGRSTAAVGRSGGCTCCGRVADGYANNAIRQCEGRLVKFRRVQLIPRAQQMANNVQRQGRSARLVWRMGWRSGWGRCWVPQLQDPTAHRVGHTLPGRRWASPQAPMLIRWVSVPPAPCALQPVPHVPRNHPRPRAPQRLTSSLIRHCDLPTMRSRRCAGPCLLHPPPPAPGRPADPLGPRRRPRARPRTEAATH